MQGDEDPKLCFARAEGKLNVVPALGIHKSDREVVRILTCRLPPEVYDAEQRTPLVRPGITRSEMEEVVRTSHANRKTKALEDRKLAVVVSTVAAPLADPHALVVGGGFQGACAGGRFGGAGPQQQQQRQYGGAGLPRQQWRQHGRAGHEKQQQRQYGGAGSRQ